MTTARPSRTLYIVLGALLVLLPLLAILQYRWIGEVNQAERRELSERLDQAGTQFVNDFDRELTRILNTFQVRGAVDRPDLSDWFAQRYDDSSVAYPTLVQRVFLARRPGTELELLQFDPQTRRLVPTDWSTDFAQVKEVIESRLDRSTRQRNGMARETLVNGNPIFIVSAMPEMPRNGFSRDGFDPRDGFAGAQRGFRGRGSGAVPGSSVGPGPQSFAGFSIVELNSKTLYGDFIPAVVARNFAANTYADYRVAIISTGPNPRVIYKSDASFNEAEMQNPDLRIPLFGPEMGSRTRPFGGQPPEFQQRGNSRPFPGFAGGMRGISLAGNWELLVKHRSGSLDTAIASTRYRDLAVAFGILLMLAVSVMLVLVSSHRARVLAQLQMDFVARVSHELRTPLAIIRSAAYNLATGVVSDEQGVREYASMVQKEGQRLSTMVDQILTFSRTESRADAYDLRPVEVDEIVDRVMSNMSSTLTAAGCFVDRKIDAGLPRVKADERAFAECLQNLLTNALKYGCSEHAARILVEARRDPSGSVVVSVADFGPGIDSADLEHIFDPFFRGKNATSELPGSGLGLNLVHRMMNAQGGRVSVDSQPGRGTRFTLHLTVSEAAS